MQTMMNVDTTSLDALTFDGSELWVSDVEERTIKKVSVANQSILKEIKFLPGGIPRAMTFANDSLVVVNYDANRDVSSELIQINVMNGKTLRTLECPDNIDSGVVFDGTFFWGASAKDKTVFQFNPMSGEIQKSFETEFPVSALSWDGKHLVLAFAKEGRKKSSGVSVMDVSNGEILGSEKIDATIKGVAFAENMIFYTNAKAKEIQVTRIKL